MSAFESLLTQGTATLGLEQNAGAVLLMQKYYLFLTARNNVMNLTTVTGEEDAARLHFLDSLALLNIFDFKGKSVVDVGSGAGFPGLPLKLMCPSIALTLLDAQKKRVAFLEELCATLGQEVSCIHARAEDAGSANAGAKGAGLREVFDCAVSRAVAELNILCELCLPLVAPGGVFIAMKSMNSDAEIEAAKNAIDTLGGEIEAVTDYEIPETAIVHRAVAVRKISATPAKYPRRFAKIHKSPL